MGERPGAGGFFAGRGRVRDDITADAITEAATSRVAIGPTTAQLIEEIERLNKILGRVRGYYNDLQAHHEKHCNCGMTYGVLLDPLKEDTK